jgi:hypothetical protein
MVLKAALLKGWQALGMKEIGSPDPGGCIFKGMV